MIYKDEMCGPKRDELNGNRTYVVSKKFQDQINSISFIRKVNKIRYNDLCIYLGE
jgi:hypothetical protein